jgi:hypothetical protein
MALAPWFKLLMNMQTLSQSRYYFNIVCLYMKLDSISGINGRRVDETE